MNRISQPIIQGCKPYPGIPETNDRPLEKKGFTVIELMIVITMIGILSSIVYPSMGRWRMNMSIKQNSRDVLFAIKTARMKAINTNSPVVFAIDAVTGAYSVADQNTGSAYVSDNIGDYLTVTTGGTVVFDAKGMPSATASFDFQTVTGESYRTIDLYLTGIAKIR